MRVRIHPADQWGCGHFRLIWPAQELQRRGHDVTIIQPGDDSAIGGIISGGRLTTAVIPEGDVFVFQRPTNILLVDLIRHLRRHGKTVVVDMDDDLSCIHPANLAFQMLHPRNPQGNWQNAIDGCKAASMVTLSTPQLVQRYAPNTNHAVLRNCVPDHYFDIERIVGEPRRWGWAGALYSHPDDVPILGRTANDLAREGHPIRIVGDPDGIGRALGLADDPEATGRQALEDWPHVITTTLDIGVAPLADTRFNRAKSWLKPLEFAALGIPFVATNTPEYSLLADALGGTAVKNKPAVWTSAVRKLLTDDGFYAEAAVAVREHARMFALSLHADAWWGAWEAAYDADQALTRLQTA
jgi:glycosyltransferase involved in cell wall biosynthesis